MQQLYHRNFAEEVVRDIQEEKEEPLQMPDHCTYFARIEGENQDSHNHNDGLCSLMLWKLKFTMNLGGVKLAQVATSGDEGRTKTHA